MCMAIKPFSDRIKHQIELEIIVNVTGLKPTTT